MDSVNFYNIRAEKTNAIIKHRQIRRIAHLFRFIEFCLVLIVISRFSSHLPNAVKNSGEYFRYFTVTLISPRFVFLIGNVIVITLFAKSGQFSTKDPSKLNSVADLYEELIIQNSEKNKRNQQAEIKHRSEQIDLGKESKIDNEVCYTNSSQVIKNNYQRSQSEKMIVKQVENSHRELRRSETEKCKKIVGFSEGVVKSSSYREDRMSNEEFRQKVEAFIARQQRLRREEQNCVL